MHVSEQHDIEMSRVPLKHREEDPLLKKGDSVTHSYWDWKVTVIVLIVVTTVALAWRFGNSNPPAERGQHLVKSDANLLPEFIEHDDMILTRAEAEGLYGTDAVAKHFGVSADDMDADPIRLWINGVVPYIFHSSINPTARQWAEQAMATIQASAPGIRFEERKNEITWLNISDNVDGGCASTVGMGEHSSFSPKVRMMRLSINNCEQYTVLHEFMHTLGFHHEQSRPDRDNYVIIHWDNILDGAAPWFEKKVGKINSQGSLYDYQSIMQYNSAAFAKDKTKPTITAREPPIGLYKGLPSKIGITTTLSDEDIVQLRRMYPDEGRTCLRPKACNFPFTYNDFEFNYCTSYDHDQPWCETATSWVDCKTQGGSLCGDCYPDECTFPFTYGGQSYDNCTMSGEHRPWCAWNATYITDNWNYCPGCQELA